MPTTITPAGSNYFDDLVAEIQLPESVYDRATAHYEAVGKWLDDEGSSIARYKPTVYPQGSIALGTAIRPIAGDEHDVDAVCLLSEPPPDVNQQGLKQMVGDRLKESERYRDMLDPWEGSRRCWTLKYREQPAFHLDVLPAIPDDLLSTLVLVKLDVDRKFRSTAIQITDKTKWHHRSWPKSNPKGFRAWFESRMQQRLQEARRAWASRQPIRVPTIHAEVEQPPVHRTPTSLQGAVQILKFHRDVYFQHRDADREDKPISIIITTLAATAYENEGSVAEAVRAIVPKMSAIARRGADGKYRIPNPVDPRENFADKWGEEPRKAKLFFEWLGAIHELVERIARSTSTVELREATKEGLDHSYAQTALNRTHGKYGGQWPPVVPPRTTRATYPNVKHKPTPPWNTR